MQTGSVTFSCLRFSAPIIRTAQGDLENPNKEGESQLRDTQTLLQFEAVSIQPRELGEGLSWQPWCPAVPHTAWLRLGLQRAHRYSVHPPSCSSHWASSRGAVISTLEFGMCTSSCGKSKSQLPVFPGFTWAPRVPRPRVFQTGILFTMECLTMACSVSTRISGLWSGPHHRCCAWAP